MWQVKKMFSILFIIILLCDRFLLCVRQLFLISCDTWPTAKPESSSNLKINFYPGIRRVNSGRINKFWDRAESFRYEIDGWGWGVRFVKRPGYVNCSGQLRHVDRRGNSARSSPIERGHRRRALSDATACHSHHTDLSQLTSDAMPTPPNHANPSHPRPIILPNCYLSNQ